jgi:hypothetical protein
MCAPNFGKSMCHSFLDFDCYNSDHFGICSYTQQMVNEAEFNSLPPRIQEHVKRTAAHNNQASGGWNMYYSPAVAPNRYKRVGTSLVVDPSKFTILIVHTDWLRERIFFETLRKNDAYAVSRLGFKAPNIFIMDLVN